MDRRTEWRTGYNCADFFSGKVSVEDERPLAVRFSYGQGKVKFTSFHDEAQLSDDVRTLLLNMILGL